MIRASGGEVAITAGTDKKCRWCRDLGAEITVNYKKEDFEEALKGQGFTPDIVLDMVGGEYVSKNLRLLAQYGRHLSIAFLEGRHTTIDIRAIMQKQLILTGSTLRGQDNAVKNRIANDLKDKIWPLLSSHQIKPALTRTFSFAQVAEAHRHLEKPTSFGKIAVTHA